jgi:hypothetical protein
MQIDVIDVVAEIWKSMLEYVPARDREAAAEHFISVLRRMDFDDDQISQLAELDHVIDEVLSMEDEEEAMYEEYEDDPEDDRY